MKIYLNIIFCVLICNISLAQGLNNNHDYDKRDIAKLFELENVEVYKFNMPESLVSTSYNIILYDYESGKLKDSFNMAYEMKEEIKKYGYEGLLPETEKGADNLLRIYLKREERTLIFNISLNGNSIVQKYSFHNIDNTGSRAFTTDTANTGNRRRLLAAYGTRGERIALCTRRHR
ncbi:MAG TPA: hypothetical protein VL053_05250 [Arachidicoccus sp.]|nr:hypothetical protein [Arachidicoccus sp.]